MKNFMIVDDSLFQRKNLGKMVSQMGGSVIAEASNGREAVDSYPHLKPDVVLMDLIMPEMEGIEAVERILAADRNAKIIVISSMGHDEIVDRAYSLGVRNFISKPVDFENVARAVRAVLGGSL